MDKSMLQGVTWHGIFAHMPALSQHHRRGYHIPRRCRVLELGNGAIHGRHVSCRRVATTIVQMRPWVSTSQCAAGKVIRSRFYFLRCPKSEIHVIMGRRNMGEPMERHKAGLQPDRRITKDLIADLA